MAWGRLARGPGEAGEGAVWAAQLAALGHWGGLTGQGSEPASLPAPLLCQGRAGSLPGANPSTNQPRRCSEGVGLPDKFGWS